MYKSKFLLFGQKLIERGAWYFAPFSWIYALAIFCRNQLYDWKWLPIHSVNATVVSVGNIVAGGTGKTPLVHLLAKIFSHRKVAILSRGYGDIPDEPMLLARHLPKVKVYVGKDRVALAREAVADGAELLILDDGFQHRRLYRDFDLVLVRNKKEHYLPWGFLRDSPKRLVKADAIFAQENPLSHQILVKKKVTRILDKQENEIPSIRGWKVGIFCGLANPDSFKKTVVDLGAEIVAEWIFADHEVADISKLLNVRALVCTEKDFVKLPPNDLPIFFVEIEMEVVDSCGLWQKLVEKIDQKIDNRHTL